MQPCSRNDPVEVQLKILGLFSDVVAEGRVLSRACPGQLSSVLLNRRPSEIVRAAESVRRMTSFIYHKQLQTRRLRDKVGDFRGEMDAERGEIRRKKGLNIEHRSGSATGNRNAQHRMKRTLPLRFRIYSLRPGQWREALSQMVVACELGLRRRKTKR